MRRPPKRRGIVEITYTALEALLDLEEGTIRTIEPQHDSDILLIHHEDPAKGDVLPEGSLAMRKAIDLKKKPNGSYIVCWRD
jgi:hypothetical protein